MPPRHSITKQQRKDLRRFAREHPDIRQAQLRTWFENTYFQKISQSTVSESLSLKFLDLDLDSNTYLIDTESLRKPEYPEIEEAIVQWIQKSHNKAMPSLEAMCEQARLFWDLLYPGSNFQPSFSTDWLMGVMKRQMNQVSKAKEVINVVERPPAIPQAETVQLQIQKYLPGDVYKCDTTRLFWKHSPDQSAALYRAGSSGIAEKRLTVHLCSNMDGTEKAQPWIVGMAATPRAFGNSQINGQSLGCTWRYSQKALISTDILREWLVEFDRQAVRKGKKVLLLMESSVALLAAFALAEDSLRNTKVFILPPNSTKYSQPFEHTILGCFKSFYRKRYLRFMHAEFSANREYLITISELDAVKWCVQAWLEISHETVINCWGRMGLCTLPEIVMEECSQIPVIHGLINDLSECGYIHKAMPVMNFVDPEGENTNVENHTDADHYMGQLTPEYFHKATHDSEGEGEAEKTPRVSHKDALFFVEQLWNYTRQQKNTRQVYFEAFTQLEDQIFQRRYASREPQSSKFVSRFITR